MLTQVLEVYILCTTVYDQKHICLKQTGLSLRQQHMWTYEFFKKKVPDCDNHKWIHAIILKARHTEAKLFQNNIKKIK